MKKTLKRLMVLLLVTAVTALGVFMYLNRDVLFDVLKDITDDIVIGDQKYTLTLSVNDKDRGSVTTDAPGPVPAGSKVNLSADPNYGYVFDGWYLGDEKLSSDMEFAYTMPEGDITVTASFEKDKFNVRVLSMNPDFTGTIDREYEYLDELSVTANAIEGTEFLAWFENNEAYSIDQTINLKVEGDITVYAEYYAYGAQVIYSWPSAAAAPVGTPLSEVELIGGSANVLGYFKWVNPDVTVYNNGEYIVTFVPFSTHNSEAEAMIGVPVATTVLTAPVVTIEDGVASWTEVDGAVEYTVQINDAEHTVPKDQHSFRLPDEMNEYFVSVGAVGDNITTASSKRSNIERYVPKKPSIEELDFGKGKSEYDENGEMVKFGDTVEVTPDNFELMDDSNVIFDGDGFTFDIEVDVADYLTSTTKRKVLDLNKFNITTDVSIVLHAQVKVIDPKVYAELDTSFPLTIKDLAFGVSYTSMVTTILDVSVNGEFVEAEQRRGTLHLLFIDLIGLEEPLYKWDTAVFKLRGTPIQVEFALGFDAIGAIAASMYLEHVEVTNYFAGIHAVENGVPLFVPYFDRSVDSNITKIGLSGELDMNLNCVRLSASLQLAKGDEVISVLRLNLDAANIESDLSGEINAEFDSTSSVIPTVSADADINGSYYFYGQITFEYYLEIKLHFGFLPLDDFGIKILDGSYILAEWEYAKGGNPKTPYKDEAIHSTTPIFATDKNKEYFIDIAGNLIAVEVGGSYVLAPEFADLDGERIVDIDDHYVYVLSGNKLRRIGRAAGTERTILNGVGRVLYSDRNYIYYTAEATPGKIEKLYRSDIDSDEPTFLEMPSGIEAIRMRYDYLLECYVIYAESTQGTAYYFSYDGFSLNRHSGFEHAWWDNVVFEDGSIAYYRQDKNGFITECFIRGTDNGITHADGATSIGISPLGIFTVTEKQGDIYSYELGLYPLGLTSGGYLKVAEVADPNVASRITSYNGEAYFTDLSGEAITVYKTDGQHVRTVAVSELKTAANTEKLRSEIHGDWLFLYEADAGSADVIYSINLITLDTAPYMVGDITESFDKGAPDDVIYKLGGNLEILGVYLNKFTDAEFEEITNNVKSYIERWNKVNAYLERNFDFWKGGEISGEEVINFLNEYGDLFFRLDAEITKVPREGEYLGNIVISLPAESLAEYSYGIHSGTIVTTMGIFDIKVNVVDSRMPTYTQDTIPTYDKGIPSRLSYEITLYDSKYTFVDVAEDAYEVSAVNGVYIFTFQPHFLSTLPYGEQSIILNSEGESFEFKLILEDSRTPKDTVYFKHFDLTYPKNVEFKFDLFDEKYITSVEGNNIPKNGAFSIDPDGSGIVFLGRYLNTLSPGDYVYTLTTAEKSFDVTVRVIRSSTPVTPDQVTHDMGSGSELAIGFEKNDASSFDVYINGVLLDDAYWRYSFVSGTILISNDYLLSNYDYGLINVTVRSIIFSGDDIKSHVNNVRVTLTDSRVPSVTTNDLIYVIPDSDPKSLLLGALLYSGEVKSIVADGDINIDFLVYTDDLYRRSAIIMINSASIIDVLGEGEHTLAITIGDAVHNVKLTVRDERLPRVIGSASASFNIDYPVSIAYILRLYGERFISISYDGAPLPDDAYTFVYHSDNSVYHILTLNKEYLDSLELGYSQTAVFTVTTNVNSFDIYVVTDIDPTNPDVPGGGDDEGDSDSTNKKPLTPPTYTPIEIATSITLTPNYFDVDFSNIFPITATPAYGTNNSFGSLKYGSHKLSEGADYSIGEGGTIILSSAFLKSLDSYGKYTVTLNGAKGKSANLTINVYDSRNPYFEGELSFIYDRFEENYIEIEATLYDSKATYLRIGETRYESGISSNGSKIMLSNALLDSIPLGTHTAYIGFGDTDKEFELSLEVHDSGLYLNDARADKATFADDAAELTLPWTLYEGTIDSCASSTLTVVSFESTSVTLSGFASAEYGKHTLRISANGHEFDLEVTVYDSRKPTTVEEKYTFDKGAYEYSLDPSVTKDYDLRIALKLYDEMISGLDMFSNQTIRGNGIEYEDYEREGDEYVVNYIYLYRLPVGDYKFYISTTDGDAEVNVTVTDSRAPYLIGESPVHYDFAAGGDLAIKSFLYDEEISSLSFIDIVSGNRILLADGVDYAITKDEDGNDVITLLENLFKEDFYSPYTYKFTLATKTERTLEFEVKIDNGPRRPFKVTYYSVPWKEGEPEYTIESLILYEGDMIPVPETPEYNYYRFLGFFTERTGGSQFNFSAPISSDCDIFLHWEPMSYSITLISDGATIGTYNVQYMSEIPAIADPTKAGYTFIKWTLDEGHQIRFNPSGETMPHRDITLYAEWQINQYAVIFKDKNGVVLKEEVLYAYEDATAPADEDMQIEHYQFLGWDKSYTSVLSDVVCSAVYKAIDYEIVYNLNEGALPSGAPLTYTIEGGVKLPIPTRTGYDFLGWYLDEELAHGPVTSIDYGTLPGFTVYARFEVSTYDVYLNSTVNGVEYDIFGAPIDNKLRITYGDEYSLPRVLVPEGYFFLGWYSGTNGTGTRYANYLGESTETWSYAGNITLYAHVVSLLDFSGIQISQGEVSFTISKFESATMTVLAIELYNGDELIANIPVEDLGIGDFIFDELLVETVYDIKVTYSYTLPDVEGVRESYSGFKIKISDDSYPNTVIGNTIAEIQVGNKIFSGFVVDSVVIKNGDEQIDSATVYYPGNTYSMFSDGAYWIYILDLVQNTEYDVTINYHYTLNNYQGTYYSTIIVPFTTGAFIPGVTAPTSSAASGQVEVGVDYDYYYYSYDVSVHFGNVLIENNLRLVKWELLRDGAVVTGGDLNVLMSGNMTAYGFRLDRGYLANGAVHQIVFTYTYDLQNGLGTVEEKVAHNFSTTTLVERDHTCFEAGTDVLMGDGSIKNIEDVRVGDMVLVWNFYTGSYDVAPVTIIHNSRTDRMFYLEFANGKRVGVGVSHGFFVDGAFVEVTRENVESLIGRGFLVEENGEMYYTELVSVEYSDELTDVYALVTGRHYNHFADGFVTVIPYIGLVNVFDYDGFKYDEEAMAADLEKYGYMDYEVFAEYLTEEEFYSFAGEYMSVAIGKGQSSVDYIVNIIKEYFGDSEITMKDS